MVWLETIVNGLLLGALYGLLGLGLALVFGVVRIVNIAHGEFIVLAAFAAFGMHQLFPAVPPLLLLVPDVLLAFAFGYALQALVLNRVMAARDPTIPMLLTFGLSFALRNLMVEVVGVNPRTLDSGALGSAGVEVAGLSVGVLPLITMAITVALFVAAQFVLQRTEFGRMVRATVDNRDVARLMSVRPERLYKIVMGLSLVLSGVAGVLLAMRSSFTPFSGVDRLLIAFEVVVLGGLGSFRGALIAGMALGVVQLIGLRLDPNSGLLYPHLLFFAGIVLRPNGFFGARL